MGVDLEYADGTPGGYRIPIHKFWVFESWADEVTITGNCVRVEDAEDLRVSAIVKSMVYLKQGEPRAAVRCINFSAFCDAATRHGGFRVV